MMCHLDSATALWIQAQVLSQDPTLIPIALDSLRRAADYVEHGRTVNSKAVEVETVATRIRELANELRRP